ncbi:STAS domain-containing protein [Cryptosporangium aurantiacum]|nr:STAS domain-containing protein [Cryptosporangium aurantiacum]
MPAPDRPRSLYHRTAAQRAGEDQMLENTPWSLTIEQIGSEIVLRASGALDLDTAGQVRSAATSALRTAAPSPTLTVDLAEVTFLDSTGLGMLVTLWHEARNVGGKFQVARPSPAALRILQITGVDALFDLA